MWYCRCSLILLKKEDIAVLLLGLAFFSYYLFVHSHKTTSRFRQFDGQWRVNVKFVNNETKFVLFFSLQLYWLLLRNITHGAARWRSV